MYTKLIIRKIIDNNACFKMKGNLLLLKVVMVVLKLYFKVIY